MEYNNLSDMDLFILSRWTYALGDPIISDAEYQKLLEMIQVQYPQNEYVLRTWSDDPCPIELLKRIGRQDLIQAVVLSDKTTSIKSLGNFAIIQLELGRISTPATLSMKHDGWNIQANYHNGNLVTIETRGRSSDTMDVGRLRRFFPATVPVTDKVKVVCELTCPKRNFAFCAKQFGNVSERSAVSTLLSRPEHHDLLEFHAVDVHGIHVTQQEKFPLLSRWGFKVPAYYNVTTYEDLQIALKHLSDEAATYGSPTDGVVYDGEIRRALRVLHWEEPIYQSYVVDYLEQFASNRISPSICIYPVLRNGTNQRRVNITNWQRIFDFDLQPGAPVAFRIASDANAAFDEETTRLLHKTYKGRWAEFADMINENERIARERWQSSIQ